LGAQVGKNRKPGQIKEEGGHKEKKEKKHQITSLNVRQESKEYPRVEGNELQIKREPIEWTKELRGEKQICSETVRERGRREDRA